MASRKSRHEREHQEMYFNKKRCAEEFYEANGEYLSQDF